MSYALVTTPANIRQGPATDFPVNATVPAGTPLTIFGRTPAGDWLQVRAPDRAGGWIAASLVLVNVPLPTIPIPSNIPAAPAPTRAPATAPAPPPTQAPPASGSSVIISHIHYDGAVPRVESDEYAAITNTGATPVNLAGWRLNAGAPGQDYTFPDFSLQPGQTCRIYTNQHHPETCGFSFGSNKPIWNNKGDCGHLYTASGTEAHTYCY